jgi:hypothetical protein
LGGVSISNVFTNEVKHVQSSRPCRAEWYFYERRKIHTVYGQITRRNAFQSNSVPSNDWNNICCEFESRSGRGVQHYVIKFVSHMRHVNGFLRALRFPPPIKLTSKQKTLIKISHSIILIFCFNTFIHLLTLGLYVPLIGRFKSLLFM